MFAFAVRLSVVTDVKPVTTPSFTFTLSMFTLLSVPEDDIVKEVAPVCSILDASASSVTLFVTVRAANVPTPVIAVSSFFHT